MSIYNDVFLIDQQLQELQERAISGETTEEERIAILESAREITLNAGLENLAKIHANRQAAINAMKEEENRIKERRTRLEKADEGLVNYMKDIFTLSGETKKTYGTFTLSWRKSTQCVVDEEKFSDDRFVTIEEIRKIDKINLKKALSEGEVINGATLIENKNLQIK